MEEGFLLKIFKNFCRYNRIRKQNDTADEIYVLGADGKTMVVCLVPYSSNLTYNMLGAGGDNIGQVRVQNTSVTGRYYYLKDHLGSIKMTLNSSGGIAGIMITIHSE